MHLILEKWYKLHKEYLYCNFDQCDFRTSELAKYLGVSRRTIERWVKGKGEPKQVHLKAIERFLEGKDSG